MICPFSRSFLSSPDLHLLNRHRGNNGYFRLPRALYACVHVCFHVDTRADDTRFNLFLCTCMRSHRWIVVYKNCMGRQLLIYIRMVTSIYFVSTRGHHDVRYIRMDQMVLTAIHRDAPLSRCTCIDRVLLLTAVCIILLLKSSWVPTSTQ